jgi:hypothetical protein
MDRSIPTGISDLIEGFKIPFHSVLKLTKILIFILIGLGDAGKVKGEVFFLESLLPSIQYLMDSLFIRNLAGQEKEEGEQKRVESFFHFSFSIFSSG